MDRIYNILKWVVAFLVIGAIGALSWWYFFLRTQTNNLPPSIPKFGDVTQFVATRDGSEDGDSTGFVPTEKSTPTTTIAQTPSQLWHITTAPVAGMNFIAGTTSVLRYIERSSGNVFEADPQTGRVVRITNTLVPQ